MRVELAVRLDSAAWTESPPTSAARHRSESGSKAVMSLLHGTASWDPSQGSGQLYCFLMKWSKLCRTAVPQGIRCFSNLMSWLSPVSGCVCTLGRGRLAPLLCGVLLTWQSHMEPAHSSGPSSKHPLESATATKAQLLLAGRRDICASLRCFCQLRSQVTSLGQGRSG